MNADAHPADTARFERCLADLTAWVEARDHTGYDPYDGLTLVRSEAILHHRVANALLTQFFKHCPVNLRPLLGMPATRMPKGVGLFLNAYALLAERARRRGDGADEAACLARCALLFDWLVAHRCPGYAGYAWNFGFPYKHLYEQPTVVITATVARGLFDYYRLTQRADVLQVLRSTCDFILEDLLVTETAEGLCFSYTPRGDTARPRPLDACYNASMLGAEVLAKVYALTGEAPLREAARRAADFTVAHQHADGRWNYSIDLDTGQERAQVDFHQGFVLDALHACIQGAGLTGERYRRALRRGAQFYQQQQFTGEGRALGRLPKRWPADVHGQAQGILTFSRLRHLDPAFASFARQVAHWTLAHLRDRAGYFYYRRGRLLTNRIPYMRWAQAWMMLALATLLQADAAEAPARVAHHPEAAAGGAG